MIKSVMAFSLVSICCVAGWFPPFAAYCQAMKSAEEVFQVENFPLDTSQTPYLFPQDPQEEKERGAEPAKIENEGPADEQLPEQPQPSVAVEFEVDMREKIVYATVDGRELLLDAFVPQCEGECPAVLVVHGGAWKSGNRLQLRAYADALAKRGFVCFAIDYRLAPKHKFPAQIEDCRTAVKWIRDNATQYQVDANRLGAIGYSAGGHLVCLLATTGEAPSEQNGNLDLRIRAAVAGGAPTDFRSFPDDGKWAEYWMGGTLKTQPERFLQASATAFVDKDDAPVFFFNGTNDKVVPAAWSRSCYEALKAQGVKAEMHTIQGAGHLMAAMNQEALDKAFAFLEEQLEHKKR